MIGRWHIVALAALGGMLAHSLHFSILLVILVWLSLLYYTRRIRLPLLLLSSIASLLFFGNSILGQKNPLQLPLNEPIQLTSAISDLSETKERIQFTAEDPSGSASIQVTYFKQEEQEAVSGLSAGAQCVIKGSLVQPDPATNPGQFNFQHYLRQQGIYYEIELPDLEDISCAGTSQFGQLLKARTAFLHKTDKILDPHTAAWVQAMIAGEDSNLDEETVELFNRWSLSHILAISGMHIALFSAILFFLLTKLQIFTIEKTYWFLFVFLAVYPVFAGGEPSVWRSALMVMLIMLLMRFRIKLPIIDSISIVFILLLVLDPSYLYHIGFQFSFLVSLALLLSARLYTGSFISALLETSLLSQLVILPLQVSQFYFLNPLSVLMNLFAIPFYTFIAIPLLLLISILLYPLPHFAALIGEGFRFLNELVIRFIQWIDGVAFYPWVTGELPIGISLIYFLVLILFCSAWEAGRRKKALWYGALLTSIPLTVVLLPYTCSTGYVTMLDIGQGDAFVIELPYRRGVYLIDAAGSIGMDFQPTDKNFDQVIKPYLYERGIVKVDGIFASHADHDHIGSIGKLTEEFHVEWVRTSVYFDRSKASQWHSDTKIISWRAGETLRLSGWEIQLLSPFSDKKDPNKNSLVMYTMLGGKSWLFTGDIGKEEEKEIIRRYPSIQADILKVGHHGSNTSTDPAFLLQLKPETGLVSAGRNNRYGHPSPEVVDSLLQQNIRIWRTDTDGAVVYAFSGKTGTFSPFLP
ncbi:DNA internalization-related competence protein ComEC/Rec2 [Terribacillus saccharophilus]|uniref:DNA internalization-related competence protein ComEC/Rec2 n=1 Tax=Terribacillus saccharophilus TaxID=361277 RepID=UPI002DC65E41|nr:DNA internalization-related competence protein ComEC/Rec2 [Terribacillus saccharophilus]MEC0290631.1 DNA internalization-related competence protein ComEC/Rec2 [Terribacillus saccharophilus]